VSQTMEFTLRLRSAIAPRTARGITRAIAIMLACASLFPLMLVAGAIDSIRGGPTTDAGAAGAPFVTAYDNPIKQVQYGLPPEGVGLDSDYASGVSVPQFSGGGYVLGGGILGCDGSYIQHALLE